VEADFQRIFEGLPGQVLILAPDGPRFTILAASDAYLRATLTERAEIVGKSFFEVFPDDPDDPETHAVGAATASFQRVVDERRVDVMGIRRHDVRRPATEGGAFAERYWQPLNSPIVGDDGQVVCIIHQVEDVTESLLHGQESDALRTANVALRESEQDFCALAAAVPQIVWTTGPDGKNTYFNQQWVDYTGMTLEESHGDGWNMPFHPDDQQRAWDAWQRATKDDAPYSLECRLRRADGTYRWWLVRGAPQRDASGTIVKWFGTLTDIEDLKRAQEQLVQMSRLYATLGQVNQTIVRVKEPEELYSAICDVAVEFGEFTLAWVGLLDEDSGDVRPVAANGADVAKWPFEAVSTHKGVSKNGLVATAIRSHEIAITGDIESDEKTRSVLGQVEGRDYHSVAAIPIGLRGKTVGVLVLVSQRSGLFKEASEVGLLEEIGQDISFALDVMQAETEREHVADELAAHATRLEIMADASKTFSAVGQDFEAVLDRVARLMSEVLADICQILLLSEDGERLELIALHGLEPDAAETLRALEGQLRLAGGSPTMWHVLQSGEPLFAPVIADDEVRALVPPEVWPAYEPFAPHSYILVPLHAQGRVTGLLSLSRTSSQRRAFTKGDLDLAQDLADRAALAISNASLLRQLQRELAERTQAQGELRESRAQLEAALASMTDAVFISDAQGNFIEFNDAFATFHRFANKAECTVTLAEYPEFLEVFMADGSEAPLEQWAVPRALRGETRTNVEYGLRRKDTGESWTGSYSFAPIRDAAGEIVGSVVVGRDVSEQKAAETALLESEERYRQLFEAESDAVFLIDNDRGAILEANMAAAKMYGYSREEMLDLAATDLSAGQEEAMAATRRSVADGEAETIPVLRHRRKDGSDFPVEITGRLFGLEDRMVRLAAIRDVTDKAQAEEELRLRAEQLRRAVEGAVLAMSRMVESRDPYTAGHERRVAELAAAIGAEMGINGGRLNVLRIAATIHDIGKIAVPAEILSKPGRLSELEFSMIKAHPTTGFDTLADIDFGGPVAEMVLQHHERLDGSGYPRGLGGEELLLEARILAVADVVEAMSSHRPYRAALGMEAALAEVREHAGLKYDAEVVAACVRVVEEQGFQFTP
jgi:PAS domain S-box-containing protein